jgi:hypothetical protein
MPNSGDGVTTALAANSFMSKGLEHRRRESLAQPLIGTKGATSLFNLGYAAPIFNMKGQSFYKNLDFHYIPT